VKISACSIVKNEALNIGRSIESYKDAVDEIIIVDTGSTDNTVDICKAYGAKILYFEWCDDFSAAKNYALEHAKGEWIIFLDADEWFVPKLKRAYLLNVLKKVDSREDGILTTMCELNINTGKVKFRGVTNRIIRGSPEIRYHGSIHESISTNGRTMALNRRLEIEIFHSGYMEGLINIKAKRNIDILYNIYNNGEATTELYFYLFRENYQLKNVDEVVKFFDLFMEQIDVDDTIKGKDALICIYEIMYTTMISNPKRFTQSEVSNLLEIAYQKYPTLPMHSYLIGTEMLKAEKYSESYEWICKAIALNKDYSGTFTNKFVGYLADAYYKLGYIRQKQDRQEEALTHFIEVAKIANNMELTSLLPKLIPIIEVQPQEEIILFFNSILDMNKKENVECMLSTLKQTRLHKVFVYFALKYNRDFDEQDETTYIAMMLSGQAELAIKTAIEASNNLKLRDANTEEPLERLKEDNTYSFSLQESLRNINAIDFTEKGVHSNWHLDYAVVGTLYSKNINLYKKYQSQFSLEQKAIMRAYFEGAKIEDPSQELMKEHSRIINLTCYILEKQDLQLLRSVVNQ